MPEIVHKIVGEYHVFTSLDLPGFYVADRDRSVAEGRIEPTLAALRKMSDRKSNEARLRTPTKAA